MEPKVCTECGHEYVTSAGRCPLDGAPLQSRPDPLLGESLGDRYGILRTLGSGANGMVYLARDLLVERWVAVKVWAPERSNVPLVRERFLREARASSLLRHPRIVDVYDYGEDRGRLFLVMELLEGESLEGAVARGQLPFLEAVEVAIQIASALSRAHQRGVVHRDIKPANVFLRSEVGVDVKVLDFGIARMLTESRLTRTGELLGTPVYMSPEQALGQPCTPASDLYSLGVTLFEMVARRPPFEGRIVELLRQHVHAPPPLLRALRPDTPEALDVVVMRLLQKEPALRHRDAHHLLDDLKRLRDALHAARSYAAEWHAHRKPIERPNLAGEDWASHRKRLTGLSRDLFDGESVPPLLARLLEQFERTLTALDTLERELDRLGTRLIERDREGHAALELLASSIDALAHQESVASRALASHEAALAQVVAEVTRAQGDLARCWGPARVLVGEPPRFDPEAAQTMGELAEAIRVWCGAVERRDRLDGERVRAVEAQRSLLTQLATERHRLDALNIEIEEETRRIQDDARGVRRELDGLRRDLKRLIVTIEEQLKGSATLLDA